eukprot:TRINITY_DN10274_c0_g1_i4.p1 TRINITY_DN10274_c0_g1~~TRINITY_DN10274_c0_g1_i4.p1  ORF type:complete len:785 (+),score=224.43 TRINITY_DN10274_c0_g1_i4:124-2478(+)
MGGISSSQRGSTEEDNASTTSVYRYPPRSGNYFSTHFIMGGEKFDSPQPESFLFGENSDLNYLGSKPVPFPYPPPQANEPTKTLKALINIRRDSLHFTKVKGTDYDPGKYNIQFTFDCDVKTSITIFYLATEEMTSSSISYTPKYEHLKSSTYSYPKGASQVFTQPLHVFEPVPLEMELIDGRGEGILPLVIHCMAEEGEQPRQSHITVGVIDKNCDGGFSVKTLKQKLFVDGLCYLIQEIYGVEKKVSDEIIEDEFEDTGAECVVCMCDSRDTLILPCRHLCLCYTCADSLRYQANNCPICRAPFRALLQLRALQKTGHSATHPALAAEEQTEGVPPGYELVSLVESLNGPFAPSAAAAQPPPLTISLDESNSAAGGGNNGGKKKKSKRRGSKSNNGGSGSKDGSGKSGSAGSKKSSSAAAGSGTATASNGGNVIEEEDENGEDGGRDLPQPSSAAAPPPQQPAEAVNLELTAASRLCLGGSREEVTVVDEKAAARHGSGKSAKKKSSSTAIEDSNKIKLEVLSQDSLGSLAESEFNEEEILTAEGSRDEDLGLGVCVKGGGSRVQLVPDGGDEEEVQDDFLDDYDTKEPTTEDELLKEDKLLYGSGSLTQSLSYKANKKDQIIHLTDDESLEAVGRGMDEGEGYFSVGSGDEEEEDEEVEVVSLRGVKGRNDSYHPSPRSSDQSSQESATSVNSSKQLLKSSGSSSAIAVAGSQHGKSGSKDGAAGTGSNPRSSGGAAGNNSTNSGTSGAGSGNTNTGNRRKRPNRSSVAPSPEGDPCLHLQ